MFPLGAPSELAGRLFANEKNIDSGGSVQAADNKLNNVNNTNHPRNRGSNKAGVNRRSNSK